MRKHPYHLVDPATSVMQGLQTKYPFLEILPIQFGVLIRANDIPESFAVFIGRSLDQKFDLLVWNGFCWNVVFAAQDYSIVNGRFFSTGYATCSHLVACNSSFVLFAHAGGLYNASKLYESLCLKYPHINLTDNFSYQLGPFYNPDDSNVAAEQLQVKEVFPWVDYAPIGSLQQKINFQLNFFNKKKKPICFFRCEDISRQY